MLLLAQTTGHRKDWPDSNWSWFKYKRFTKYKNTKYFYKYKNAKSFYKYKNKYFYCWRKQLDTGRLAGLKLAQLDVFQIQNRKTSQKHPPKIIHKIMNYEYCSTEILVCYCWRKQLDTGKIGRIQTSCASDTKDFYRYKFLS